MANWYYVQGSERVGPVGVETLKDLFHQGELTFDSYVWKKGFQNWEHIKDVSELDFSSSAKVTAVEEESSPELNFHFEWSKVREEEELFFLKVGNDRKHHLDQDLYGPYSLTELKEAIIDKRINNHTLIFTAGMPGWIEVGDTPLDPKNLIANISHIKDTAPLLLLVNHQPLPLMALVHRAGTKECTLLGAGPFQAGSTVLCSLYSGSTLKAKNVKLNIAGYNPREQTIHCRILEMDEIANKIMLNYAE